MSNLIIAIGSTGAQALESFINLSNAGLIKGNEEVKVIFVDKDEKNAGNVACRNFITEAMKAKDVISNSDFGYIKTSFSTDSWTYTDAVSSFKSEREIEGTADTLASLAVDPQNQNEVDILLNSIHPNAVQIQSLDRGFYGRPNIGATLFSLVTNDGNAENPFVGAIQQAMAGAQNIKVFVVGSIFGGTGASIFPNVAKIIKKCLIETNVQGVIGGALVLPYFSVPTQNGGEVENIVIRSSEFMERTKVALGQYAQSNLCNGTPESIFDSLFLIGDKPFNNIGQYSIGGASQENHFHIVDMYTGYAACEFFNKAKPEEDNDYRGIYLAKLDRDGLINSCGFTHLPDDLASAIKNFANFSIFLSTMVLPSVMGSADKNEYLRMLLGSKLSKKHKGEGKDVTSIINNLKEIVKVCNKFLIYIRDISLNGVDWNVPVNNQIPNVSLFVDAELKKIIACNEKNIADSNTEIEWYDPTGNTQIMSFYKGRDETDERTLNSIQQELFSNKGLFNNTVDLAVLLRNIGNKFANVTTN
ncbi:MAG: tubulin-like doman-containing protein [Eubacteriaceae bacterium]